jgi:hypothetical protein
MINKFKKILIIILPFITSGLIFISQYITYYLESYLHLNLGLDGPENIGPPFFMFFILPIVIIIIIFLTFIIIYPLISILIKNKSNIIKKIWVIYLILTFIYLVIFCFILIKPQDGILYIILGIFYSIYPGTIFSFPFIVNSYFYFIIMSNKKIFQFKTGYYIFIYYILYFIIQVYEFINLLIKNNRF